MAESTLALTASSENRKKFAQARKRFQHHAPQLQMDAEGTLQYVSPAARRLLEYGPEDSVQECFFSLVHGRNMYQVMRDVADMVCYGKPRANWLVRLKTGRDRWTWLRATVTNRLNEPENDIQILLSDLQEA
ncbi:MAG: PAS domain-containing protein [Rhodothermales bacterium]